MPWPQDNFAEFLRQQIEANKGKKPKFEQWSYSKKGGEPRPFQGEVEYTPGKYGYIPPLKETMELPPYAQGQSTQQPFSGVGMGQQWQPRVPNSTQVPNEFVAQYPDYKDRIQEWRNGYYRMQFADDYQKEYIPGVNVPNVNGDSLDKYPGALGWDRNGDPYYGHGVGGWLSKFYNRIRFPYGTPPEDAEEQETARQQTFAVSGGKSTGGGDPERYKYWGTGFGMAGRAATEVANTVIAAADVPAKGTEGALSIPLEVAEFGKEGYQVPGVGEVKPIGMGEQAAMLNEGVSTDMSVRDAINQVWRNYAENAGELFRQNLYRNPFTLSYNFLRNASLKTPGELKDDIAEGWQSGGIAYSAFVDPAIREEFVRRLKAGENPDLLTQEFENPWAELAGRIVFDPLNMVGMGSKAVRDARRVRAAVDYVYTLSPEVEKVVAHAADISKVTGKTAIALPNDIKAAESMVELTTAVASDWAKHGEKVNKAAANYAPWALTSLGKRNQMARNMGEFIANIAANTADDGDVVDIYRGLYQIAYGSKSGNTDMVATGITALNNLPNPAMGLSDAGKDTGTMLYALLGDDPKNFFTAMRKASQKGTPEFIQWLGTKLDDATAAAFPTVTQRIAKGENIPFATRAVNKFHNDIGQKVYKPINSFFAGVYMGLSPGYAFRNTANNLFTEVVDEGFGSMMRKPDMLLAELDDMLGGAIPKGIGGFGGGVQGIETAGYEKKFKNFTDVANASEYNSSVRTVHAAVTKSMRKMMQPGKAIPDTGSMVQAGLPKEVADLIPGLFVKHKYNVNKVVDEIVGMAKDGEAWALSSLAFLGKDADKLDDFGMLGDILKILDDTRLNNGTADDAVVAIKQKWQALRDASVEQLRKSTPVVDENAEGVEMVTGLMGAKNQGVAIDYLDNAMHYTQANSNAIRAFEAMLGENMPQALMSKKTALYAKTRQRTERAARLAGALRDDTFDMAAEWKRLGMTGDPPTKENFLNRVWREYVFEPNRKDWEALRGEYAQLARQAFEASGETLNPGLYAEALNHYDLSKRWDNVMRKDEVRNGLWKAINRGDAGNAARIYGAQFDLPQDQHLLNAINKYLPEGKPKYGSLASIPIDDLKDGGAVEQSLIRRLRVKAGVEKMGVEAEPGAVKAAEGLPAAGEAAEAVPLSGGYTIRKEVATPEWTKTGSGADAYKPSSDVSILVHKYKDGFSVTEVTSQNPMDNVIGTYDTIDNAKKAAEEAGSKYTHRFGIYDDTGSLVDSIQSKDYAIRYAQEKYNVTPIYDELTAALDEAFDIKSSTPRKAFAYRGMSEGEYNFVKENRYIQSDGRLNLSNEEGLTLYSSDPSGAHTYATGFAVEEYRPTASKPSYVIEVKKTPSFRVQEKTHYLTASEPVPVDNITKVIEIRLNDAGTDYVYKDVTQEFLSEVGVNKAPAALEAATAPAEDIFADVLKGTPEEQAAREVQNVRSELLSKFYSMDRQTLSFKAPEVDKALESKLYDMVAELDVGEPGYRKVTPEGVLVTAKSSYPDWYGPIAKTAGGKENVKKALTKLITGQGLDTGATVEKLRSIALDAVFEGNKDPIMLWNIGLKDEAVMRLSMQMRDEFFDLTDIANREGFSELYDATEKFIRSNTWPEPDKAQYVEALMKLEELAKKPPVAPSASNAAGMPRAIVEQADGIEAMLGRLGDEIANRWDTYYPTISNNDIMRELKAFGKTANTRVSEARMIAQLVGNAARDFTLLNYGEKRYFDLALAYIMPYHFWYNRSYAHWLQRLAWNPEVIAGYAKYKDAMSKVHAGAPEWWRYNVNTNDLLGMDSENPLYFNLEASLWPLNGLTGVDFDDPNKRVNWWTAAIDDVGKLGPSVWTPINMATALALQAQGEDEAAQRWGGRLIPQTAALKSVMNLMNINVPTRQGINEFDPSVLLFSNGLDPYERRRAMRALAMMVEEGTLTQADAADVAYNQSGPIWQQAITRAQDSRAMGQLSSFALGVGFKMRSESDMQIDMFDQEWRQLWARANDMTPEEVRIKMDELRDKYPFGDQIIIGRKNGLDRDRSFAYNVMSRIPPGQKSEIADLVGLNSALFDKFYTDKGRMDKWPETDYMKFMASIVEIGAVLDLPDSALRAEWTDAKNAYDTLNKDLQAQFGEDINQRIDVFYNKRKADQDAAYAWLEDQPDLQEAMDYKERQLIYDPQMAPYYASIDKIENYYRSRMYDAIEREMGSKVWDLLDQWANIKDVDQKAANAFWDKNGLDRYSMLKDAYQSDAADATAKVGQMLQPFRLPNLREGENLGVGAQDLLGALGSPAQNAYQYSWSDWSTVLPNRSVERLLTDYFGGTEMSYSMEQRMDRLADEVGLDREVMLRLMQDAYYSGQ